MSVVPYKALAADGKGGNQDAESHPYERRNFDMCMVFKYKISKDVLYGEADSDEITGRKLKHATDEEKSLMDMWKQRRESTLKSLQNCGLNLHCFYSRDRDCIIVKIGASSQKLRDTAARMKYKLQLKPEYLGAYAEFRHDFPGRKELNFEDRRVVSHLYKLHTDDPLPDDDAIFSTMDKITIVNHVVTSKDKDCAGIPVGQLMHKKELKAFFPLHENAKLADMSVSVRDPTSWYPWFMMNPEHANNVRDYFGDKVAYYFLFMAFYWKWLLIPTSLGLVLQLVDLLYRTPDNTTAVPWCIYIGIWSTFLPHFWRRQVSKYSVTWGTLELEAALEPCRPQHYGEPRINPVTAQVEPFFKPKERLLKYAVSLVTVATSGVLVVFVQLLLLLARHKFKGGFTSLWQGTLFYQVLLAAVVEVVNAALSAIARYRTHEENHRTQTEHDVHLMTKCVCFKFVNSYFALYYMAFFKRHSSLFGSPVTCIRDDCYLELQAQLAIFVIFHLVVQNLFEYAYPKVKAWYRGMTLRSRSFSSLFQHDRLELADMSSAEQEANKEPYDAFADFDETLVSHGFATLFSVSSPWICLAVLLGVLFEIILDAKGMTESRQRPLPVKAKDNEPWSTAFDVYGIVAAFTNVALLIFGSDLYDSWRLTEKLTLFIFLEHLILCARLILSGLLPVVPASVRRMQMKNEFMVHRSLENIKVEASQDFSHMMAGPSGGGAGFQVMEADLFDEDDVDLHMNIAEDFKTFKHGAIEAANTNPITS